MKKAFIIVLLMCFVAISCKTVETQEKKYIEVTKTFGKKDVVNMNFVRGDCKIVKSENDNINVTVTYKLKNENLYEPQMNESDNSLTLIEHFKGSTSGDIKWTVSIPSDIKINFNSASGDFQLNNLSAEVVANTASGDVIVDNYNGNMKINTASGDIKISNVDGILKFNTASGDIVVNNSKSIFKFSTASGDILASNITLTDNSSFNTASGDVNIGLTASPDFDISINTASGDAVLNYNGNPISGHFELSVRKNSGEIVVPFKFEKDGSIKENDGKNIRTVTIEKETPVIKMNSASGDLTINK